MRRKLRAFAAGGRLWQAEKYNSCLQIAKRFYRGDKSGQRARGRRGRDACVFVQSHYH
jgi:hypothetical protein